MALKVSAYSTQATALAAGDLFDLTKLISTGPNVYESQKADINLLEGWNLFGQDFTMPAPRLHNLSNNQFSLTNGRVLFKGSDDIGTDLFKLESLSGNEVFKAVNSGQITIAGAFTLPTADGTIGQALKTNGAGVVSWGDSVDDNVYTADGILTGNRIIDIGSANTLTIKNDGTASNFEINAASGGYVLFNRSGGAKIRPIGGGNEPIVVTNTTGTFDTFTIKKNGGGSWSAYNGVKIGELTTNDFAFFTIDDLDFYKSNVLLHRIGFGTNGSDVDFWINGASANNSFRVGGSTLLDLETISLKGKTIIKGEGTTTGTTLALYDNDTTPALTWEWLDNGNVNIGTGISPIIEVDQSITFNFPATSAGQFIVDGSSQSASDSILFEVKSVGTGNSFNIDQKGEIDSTGITGTNILNIRNSSDTLGLNIKSGVSLFHVTQMLTRGAEAYSNGIRQVFTSTTEEMKWQQASSLDFNHQIKSGTAAGSNEVRFFNKGWANSDGFIIGSASAIGSEDISLQGDVLMNANVNMPNLPTSSVGLSAGDVWNDGGTLKIV
jgi:hypothetical protein